MRVRKPIFVTPRANQGQTVEVSFADDEGGQRAWSKVVDHSLSIDDPDRVVYLRRVDGKWAEPTPAQLKWLQS